MYQFLIHRFIKNRGLVKDPKVRSEYSKLAAVVGICSNLILCAFKITVGLVFDSIAILADGVNNLTDASSSLILLIGTKLSAKPADREHPFGHARIEYITGLMISLFIVFLGFQLLLASGKKILHPDPVSFHWLTVAVLAGAILIKVWQAGFYWHIGKAIASSTIKATGSDSRNDVIATSAVLLSVLFGKFTGIQIDGWVGGLVALFIIYSGYQLILETSSPLLGGPGDPELVRDIEERILSFQGVKGIHDLVVHSYGPGRTFATVHIEVDCREDIILCHDMIDNIERTVSKDLSIELVAHMDPLDPEDPLTARIHDYLTAILDPLEGVLGHHDLRVIPGYTHQNIIFDVVVSQDCPMCEEEIISFLEGKLRELSPTYFAVITVDRNYSSY